MPGNARLRAGAGSDDDDGCPRSVYDAPDDPPSAQDEQDDDADDRAGPVPDAGGAWRAAVAACAADLAEAAAGFARLDERLRVMPPPERDAARVRLATLQAVRLMWGAGDPVAPEAVALDALDRRGRADEDAPAVTAARRIARALARDLPRGGGPVSGGAPPLVAAALAGAGAGAATQTERLDAATAALRTAARAGRGGALFAPVPARRRPGGGTADARLAAFLRDVADGARDALALLDDLAAWRARAEAAAAAMKGPTPGRVAALLARRPAVAAPAAAAALGLSDDAALRALLRLEREGIARELTGQGRFRVWAARL